REQDRAGLRGHARRPDQAGPDLVLRRRRFTKPETSQTLSVTGINYATSTDERRYEGKVTYAPNTGNNARFGYTKRTTSVANNRFGTIMDLASLYDNSTDQHLYTANYTSVVSNTFLLEDQY